MQFKKCGLAAIVVVASQSASSSVDVSGWNKVAGQFLQRYRLNSLPQLQDMDDWIKLNIWNKVLNGGVVDQTIDPHVASVVRIADEAWKAIAPRRGNSEVRMDAWTQTEVNWMQTEVKKSIRRNLSIIKFLAMENGRWSEMIKDRSGEARRGVQLGDDMLATSLWYVCRATPPCIGDRDRSWERLSAKMQETTEAIRSGRLVIL